MHENCTKQLFPTDLCNHIGPLSTVSVRIAVKTGEALSKFSVPNLEVFRGQAPITSSAHCFMTRYCQQISGAKKAREEIQHKEFWGPQDPPPQNSLCRPFSCILKGKRGPNINNLRDQGSPGGGLGEGISAQFLYVYALFWFLKIEISQVFGPKSLTESNINKLGRNQTLRGTPSKVLTLHQLRTLGWSHRAL